MYVNKRTLLITISIIIIIVIVTIIYPLTFNNKITFENLNDFNSIKNNSIIEENILVQKEICNSWFLSIPKINLNNIEIHESVDNEILEKYIGHFEFSSYVNGNICLAAHNSGFKNNYFENLYVLETSDEIIYTYEDITKTYIVTEKYIISQNDFSILEDDGTNELTLITCVSNSPDLRLCVKAVSKE